MEIRHWVSLYTMVHNPHGFMSKWVWMIFLDRIFWFDSRLSQISSRNRMDFISIIYVDLIANSTFVNQHPNGNSILLFAVPNPASGDATVNYQSVIPEQYFCLQCVWRKSDGTKLNDASGKFRFHPRDLPMECILISFFRKMVLFPSQEVACAEIRSLYLYFEKYFIPYRNRLVSSRSCSLYSVCAFFSGSGNIFRSIFSAYIIRLWNHRYLFLWFATGSTTIYSRPGKLETACADSIATFVLFSCFWHFCFCHFFSEGMHDPIWKGIYFLCVLPSTVSTSVVMVSVAGGNIPTAIFNASLSRILGVFITPFMDEHLVTKQQRRAWIVSNFIQTHYSNIVTCRAGISVTFPFSQPSRKKTESDFVFWSAGYTLHCVHFFCTIIFQQCIFSSVELKDLLFLSAGMALLFALVFGLLNFTGTFAGFDSADRKTLVFADRKNLLTHGTVMSAVFFAQTSGAGVVLLPLMLYHALQIVLQVYFEGMNLIVRYFSLDQNILDCWFFFYLEILNVETDFS